MAIQQSSVEAELVENRNLGLARSLSSRAIGRSAIVSSRLCSPYQIANRVREAARLPGSIRSCVTKLDPALFWGTAAVVRQRRDVFDGLDQEAGGLDGRDGAFSSGARSLDLDLHLLDAVL